MANEVDYDAPIFEAPDGSLFIKGPDAGEDNFDLKPTGLTLREVQKRAQQRITDEPSLSKTASQFLLGLEEGATVATPRAIGGGFEFAGGLLPDAVGGAALRKIGREAREGAGQIGKEYEDLSEGVGGGGVAKFARGLGSSVIPSASALLAAAPLGVLGAGAGATVTGSAVASGLQSLGGTFADAFEANKKRGMSDEEAYRKSYTPAVLSGLVTGLVTKGFGGTGLEPILLGKAVPKGFAAAVKAVAKDVGMEAVEEATDEAWQAVIRNTTFNPEATAEDNLKGILQAGIAGGLMAGAVRGAQSAPSAVSDLFTKKPDATPAPLPAQPAPAAPVAPTPVAAPQVAHPQVSQRVSVPIEPPPMPKVSGLMLNQPLSTWSTSPSSPNILAQSPDSFGIGNKVVKLSQAGGGFGKVGTVTAMTGPKVDGNPNPTVSVTFDDGTTVVSGFKEFGFLENVQQAKAMSEAARGKPFEFPLPPPSPKVALPEPPAKADSKRTVPLDAAEQLQQRINAVRAAGDVATARKLAGELDMLGTPKPRRVAITPAAQAAAPKRQQELPEAPALPEALEGQPYDTRLENRPEASMPAIPVAELGIERGRAARPVDPDLAETIEALRQGYRPQVERQEGAAPATLASEYDAARSKFSKVSKAFREAQTAYRNRSIGDTEFLVARKRFDEASEVFDKAESKFIEETNRAVEAKPAKAVKPDAPEAQADKDLIAKTPPAQRVDIDNGTRVQEFRVRKTTSAEMGEQWVNYYTKPWVVERRTVKRNLDTGEVDNGEWSPFARGETRQKAIEDGLGDTAFMQAESVDDTHKKVVAKEVFAQQWRADKKKRLDEANREVNYATNAVLSIKEDANKAYKTALKRAKLYEAAQTNSADPAKLKIIQEKLQAEVFPLRDKALADLDQAKASLKAIEAETQPPYAPQEQAPVEVLRGQPPGTPAPVAEGKPGEVSQAAGEGAKEARDKSKPEQMTPEEFSPKADPINQGIFKSKKEASERLLRMVATIRSSKKMSGILSQYGLKPEDAYEIAKTEGGKWSLGATHKHRVATGFLEKKPVSASAVDTYGIKLPPDYIREGELYVYRPEGKSEQARVETSKTPLQRQWEELKTTHPSGVLAVRLGDFYEFFFDDAKKAASVLKIALTKRGKMAMAGIPYHAFDRYSDLLRAAGNDVHVVDMVGEAKPGQPVRREAVKTLPSTDVGEQQVLDEVAKLKSVTGPLNSSERIDLNELRLSAQNKKLSRLSQAYLENLEERAKSATPQEGIGSIYQMDRRGETKWLVQQGEKRGFGDSIFDTEQEAVAESQREAARREQRAESLRKMEAEKDAEAKAKAEREDLGTFTDGMSPMKRGAVVKQLTARFRYLGKEMSRRDIIRELVNQGRKVETEDGQRVLSNDKDEYLGEKVLTKAGLDYAEHLIRERDAQMSLGQTPTARPAPSLSKMQVEQAVRELFDGSTPPNFQVTHNYGKTFNNREVRGWYDPATGTIWLNAAYLRSPQEARAVFVEEAFHAIQNDKAVQEELSRLVASLTPEQLAEARSAYGNISEEQLRMEAVADILEQQQLTQEQRGILARLWDAVVGAVQRLYGKFTGKVFTERDAQDVLVKALKAAAVGKRSLKSGGEVYADGDAASVFKYSKVPTGKYSPQQLAAVANEFRALASNPKAFKYPTSNQTDIAKIAEEMAPGLVKVSREESEDGDSLIKLTTKNGSIYINDVGGDRPYMVSTDAGSAGVKGGLGTLLYQIAFTWAHNNGKTVVASPSLSEIAILRRTSNMLSSALRFGTTDHLRPDPSQRVEWVVGDTWGNIARLALKEYELVNAATGGLSDAPEFNPETLSFGRPDRMQQAVSGVDRLAESQQEQLGKYAGIGSTTLQRAIFTESARQRSAIPDGKVGQGAVGNPQQAAYLLRLMQSDDAPQLLYGVGSPQNKLDQQYFEAIQRGDMQEVQRLVDEAARGAGYVHQGLFHGSGARFNSFMREFRGSAAGGFSSNEAFFLTDSERTARAYAAHAAEDGPVKQIMREAELAEKRGDWDEQERLIAKAESMVYGEAGAAASSERRKNAVTYPLFARGNLLKVDAGGKSAEEFGSLTAVIQQAKRKGLDGVLFANLDDAPYLNDPSDHYAIFNPSNIKSADPITYDDQGQPIPLSQRFQQESPDIRYSLGERVQGPEEDHLGAKYTDAIRASESAGSRQDFLRGTDAQIEAAITGADDTAVVRQGVGYEGRPAGAVRGLYSGSKSAAGKAVPKVRVFISTDALDSSARKNAEILASRIFPTEPGAQASALSYISGRDLVQSIAGRTPFFVTIFSAEGAKSPLARTQTLADGTPAIIFNTTNLGKFNLQDAATATQFDGVLSEELIHVAAISVTSQKEAQDVWASLSDKERKATERSYNRRRNKDALSDYELGHEYLRMVIQERMFGKTTEQVELRITEPVKKFLRKLLNFIKEAFGKKPENDIARQLVSRIESALNGELPRQSSVIPSGTSLATNISQSDATEVQGRAIEPSVIAAAGKAVADLGRKTVEEFEQAGRQLEGLAYESKQFRQARSELNRLVKDHDGLLQQRYPDRADLRTSILEGVSVENGQIVVSDALVTKLAQMGIQFRPELVRAMQAEIYFEQQARRLVDTQEKRDGLIELRDYYQRVKAPDEEVVKLSKMIAAKQKVITSISPVTTQRGGNEQSVAERANEIKQAEASKVELQSKRDALNLEPVQEFFGKGITELRDLSEKAKAAADLTRALMDSSTSISEVARLGEIYDKWAGFDATVKDALKQGTLTDEQRVSVLTSLQQSFNEFDEAKFRMDDLFNSEEKGLLKDIREAEADIADAKVNTGMADILVADALKAAKGEMGLTGTVGDASNIANLEKSVGMISTLAENLGKSLDQNRWLYDFLMAPGDMPAFGASVATSLNISEDTLLEVLRVVQKSPSLASAIVTIADHAASKRASSPPAQMESIAKLATSGNPLGMVIAANLTSKIVQQANAQSTAAKAVQKAAAGKLAQSVLRLRTLQQGQALFNQTANSAAFQQLRSAVAAGASEAQKMVVLGPTGPVLRGFKSAAKEYQPELKINVESDALELQKTRDKVWKYLQNAEQYVEDYEAAAAAYAANPANPSPSQLGFDVADYNGLKFAIENQIWPMFLNMGDMDDAARAGQYLTPVAVRKLMKAPAFIGQVFNQYEQIGKMVGGFAGNIFRQQIAKYKRGYLNAKRVASQFQDLPKLQSAAMQSHNIKSEDTYRKIFNEMAHYGRVFGSPLRVGFRLPIAQQAVTKEDMEFFKRTLAFEERLRRDVTEIDPVTGVRYTRNGKEITRKGSYVGDKGMPRHLNRWATLFIANITDAYAGTPKGFTATTDLSTSSQDGPAAFWNKNLGTLKQHVLDSLRTDRSFKQSAEMAAAEKKIAARWLAGNMDQVNSVQDLVDLIAAEIPATSGGNPLDTARQGLNSELLQYLAHAERIQKERAEDNAKTSGLSIALSSENEYTKPAAYLELPSEYYDYGAVSSVDRITAQARANHSSLVDFANSLRLAIKELESRMDQLRKATTDKQREAILENYKGNPQEMEDVLELLKNSLKNFEDSYRAGGPDIVPTKLGQKLLKATVGSVLAKFEIAIRNLSQGQIQVFTNLRAMNYMSAKLAAWKALSNVPRGLVNTGYLVARNIAGFADRRLGRDPQFQRTLKGAVDVLADGIFKSAQLALLKPRVGAANVRASFERVNSLGFDTSNDWWETAKQAWTESGQFRNQMKEDEAMKSRTGVALHFLDRMANTGLDAINAFVRGSVLESSDTNMNALSLGLVGNMEQRLEEVAMVFGKRLTDAGITEIDPANKDSMLRANEWLPSLNQQTAVNSLGEIRKFLESSASSEGFHLEKSLLQYYQDKLAGKPAKIFNQRTFDAVQRSMIAENNAALPTNRASAGQASTLWRTLLTLQGYPADAFLKLLRISTGGSRDRNAVLQAASKISMALGFAAMAIILQGAGDAGSELWKRKVQGKKPDRVTPLDSEFWTNPDHMKRAMGRYLMMSAYYLGNAMEAAYGWTDGRTTIDPTQRAFAIATTSQIIRDITSGAKIAMKGGSVAEALEPLRRSMMRLTFAAPELEYLLGKERDSAEGARRAMTENAKAQGIELPAPGFTGTVGLTNVKRKALSQAVSDMDIAKRKGDTEGYNKAKAAAQKQIAELEAYYLKQRLEAGDSPEVAAKTAKASTWGDYQENNPVTAALGGKRPTAEQYKQLVGDATTERGQSIRQGIKAWQDGAQALFGKSGNITKEDVAENRPSGTVREPSYGRVSLTGGVSGRMKSVGTVSSRGRRAKIRRVSLTGRRRKIGPMRSRRKKIRRVRLTA